jgi:hypothetical protein
MRLRVLLVELAPRRDQLTDALVTHETPNIARDDGPLRYTVSSTYPAAFFLLDQLGVKAIVRIYPMPTVQNDFQLLLRTDAFADGNIANRVADTKNRVGNAATGPFRPPKYPFLHPAARREPKSTQMIDPHDASRKRSSKHTKQAGFRGVSVNNVWGESSQQPK